MPSETKLTRKCSKCKQFKDDSLFYKHHSINPDGIRKKCNDCRKIYRKRHRKENVTEFRKKRREYESKNRESINSKARIYRKNNPKRFKGYYLKKDFGITLDKYEKLLKEQNNLCKLSNQPEKTKHQNGKLKDLAVDHCHITGKIRGLLCWVCNTGIGKLKDSPELLRRAADYIEGKI